MYSVVLMAALTTTTADAPSWGCHGWGWRGCHGCWGLGGGCFGCNGCYGGCYGWNGCCGCNGVARYNGWRGCYGGCYGGGFYTGCIGGCHSPYAPVPAGPAGPPPRKPPEKIMKPATEEKKETSTAKDAKLIVDLPTDAKLFIDDRPMNVSSQHPVFVTPELKAGKTYYYDLRAEIRRDGKVLSDFKRLVFHAGDELRESFAGLGKASQEKVAADRK